MDILNTKKKNEVLASMMRVLDQERAAILAANKQDLDDFQQEDRALYDRLRIDDKKIDLMIKAVKEVMDLEDPVGRVISSVKLENGLHVENRTEPFGTILIIYESRPDVTIEAAVVAFKANSKILLKGGKEAVNSNKALVHCWHLALAENDLADDWIRLFTLNRAETQEFLRNPAEPVDLIVPRGGEKLIAFVKEHAQCAVLISGRGNNFAYIAPDANWDQTSRIIVNAKTDKISACNALDKVLIDVDLPDLEGRLQALERTLVEAGVEILAEDGLLRLMETAKPIASEDVWYEEFLAPKICLGQVNGVDEAIQKINKYSGGHSCVILTENTENAREFMRQIDSAAVYHNASTRFTDGGQMGVGAELAISTDKLHHRGPLGLKQLVTNKYFVFGTGQVRE